MPVSLKSGHFPLTPLFNSSIFPSMIVCLFGAKHVHIMFCLSGVVFLLPFLTQRKQDYHLDIFYSFCKIWSNKNKHVQDMFKSK